MKKLFPVFGLVVLVIVGIFYLRGVIYEEDHNTGIVVSATTFPLADMTDRIAGEYVDVVGIVPPGESPHDYELSPKDTTAMLESSLVIHNGAGMEPWMEDVKSQLSRDNIMTLSFEKYAETIPYEPHGEESHSEEGEDTTETGEMHEGEEAYEEGEDHWHSHEHGEHDPHMWLSVENMITMAREIETAMSKVDPKHEEFYAENTEAYIEELEDLKNEYARTLTTCEASKAIVAHDAYSYLEEEFGLEFIPVEDAFLEQEPTASDLQEIVTLIREESIPVIYYEDITGREATDSIAAETGIQQLPIHPIGGITTEEAEAGVSYISLMEGNLESLRQGLSCQ